MYLNLLKNQETLSWFLIDLKTKTEFLTQKLQWLTECHIFLKKKKKNVSDSIV